MAINKIQFKLAQDIRRRLDTRILNQEYSNIPKLHQWLVNQGGMGISQNTLRRYVKRLLCQTDGTQEAVRELLSRPEPEDMPESAVFGELGCLSRLAHVISERITALHRELDARHAAEAVKGQPKPGGSRASRPGGL